MTETCNKYTKITRRYRATKAAEGQALLQIHRYVPAEMLDGLKKKINEVLRKALKAANG